MHHKPYTLPIFLTAAIFEMTHEINILLMSTTSNVGHAFNTSKSYKRVWIAKCSESGVNLSVEPYSKERGSAVFWLLHFLSLLLDGISFLLSPGCSSSDVILNDFHSKLGRIHIIGLFPHTREGSICLASWGGHAIYVWTAEQGSGVVFILQHAYSEIRLWKAGYLKYTQPFKSLGSLQPKLITNSVFMKCPTINSFNS